MKVVPRAARVQSDNPPARSEPRPHVRPIDEGEAAATQGRASCSSVIAPPVLTTRQSRAERARGWRGPPVRARRGAAGVSQPRCGLRVQLRCEALFARVEGQKPPGRRSQSAGRSPSRRDSDSRSALTTMRSAWKVRAAG